MIINVNNRYDIPYGIFSVGYPDSFYLDGNNWNNIIEYVSSINGQKYNIPEPYDINMRKWWDNLTKEKINQAIKVGIDAKSRINQDFESILLTSETRPILYISEDSYLGVDFSSKQGENIYGKWLTSYRNMLLDGNSEVFYNIYILERLLSVAINFEPLDTYLKMSREGKSIRALIEILYDKYKIDLPSREIVEGLRELTTKNYSYNAEEIIIGVMKNKIRSVRVKNLNLFKHKIFESFVTGVMKKYKIKNKYSAADFIKLMPTEERNYSIERVYDGYTTKKHPEKYPEIEPPAYIPTQEEINNIEKLKIEGIADKIPHTTSNYAIVDSRTSKLSLKYDKETMYIDGKEFPSLAHYIIYQIGTLINDQNFSPYNMIRNPQDNRFYRIDDSQKFLVDNLEKYYDFSIKNKLSFAVQSRFNQQEYLKDYLKSMGPASTLRIRDYNTKTYSDLINQYNQMVKYADVMEKRGSVFDYIETDHFFMFIQKEMFENFLNIFNIVSIKRNDIKQVKSIYENFFGNIPGIVEYKDYDLHDISINNFRLLNQSVGNPFDEESLRFLKRKFVERILQAEQLAIKLYNTNVIFMTKFLILESRYRIFNGEFINPKMRYGKYNSKEYLALAKVCNAIIASSSFKVLIKTTVDQAFNILNNINNVFFNQFVSEREIEETIGNRIVEKPEDDENDELGYNYQEVQEVTPVKPSKNEEEEGGEEEEIEGYESAEDDEEFDDLMYAGKDTSNDSDKMALYIFNNMKPSKEVKRYIDQKAKELYNSLTKNVYRINLYQ